MIIFSIIMGFSAGFAFGMCYCTGMWVKRVRKAAVRNLYPAWHPWTDFEVNVQVGRLAMANELIDSSDDLVYQQ